MDNHLSHRSLEAVTYIEASESDTTIFPGGRVWDRSVIAGNSRQSEFPDYVAAGVILCLDFMLDNGQLLNFSYLLE